VSKNKKCSKCKKEKNLENFCKDIKRNDKKNPWCKTCCKKYREANKEKISKYKKDWHQMNRVEILKKKREYSKTPVARTSSNKGGKKYRATIKGRISTARKQSKRRNKTWDIPDEMYLNLIHCFCRYCGDTLLDETGIGLDRLNNDRGYFIDNVVPCCRACNSVRWIKYTYEEMLIIGKYLKKARQEIEKEDNDGN